jgi:hypothetical protein
MKLEIISDKNKAKYIFMTGLLTEDNNKPNYTETEFNIAWDSWLNFYVLYNNEGNVVSFCGIRKFKGGYGRIFDRYFCMPEYRIPSFLNEDEVYIFYFLPKLMIDCRNAGLIPFFSIQSDKKKKVSKLVAKKFNKLLPSKDKFKVLDGLYCTAPGSWQNIAMTYPYKTLLKRKKDG